METDEILIQEILDNKEDLYEGGLSHYFVISFLSKNAFNPYHNFRHTMTVICESYKAIKYYQNELNSEEIKALLITSFFHDFEHSGKNGDDKTEVENAIKKMKSLILQEDKKLIPLIERLIKATEYPYNKQALSLGEKIIRDTDLSQALFDVWIQQVIFSLAKEHRCTPLEILKQQTSFLLVIKF